MNQAGQLYRLQRIDTQIDQASSRVEQIDRLLREDERMQSAGAACDAAKVRMEKARNALRSIEHLTTEQQVKIEQTNDCLYLVRSNGEPKVCCHMNGTVREGLLYVGQGVTVYP